MRIRTIFSFLTVFFLLSFASVVRAQFNASIKAGTHVSAMVFENESGDQKISQFTPGFHIGLSTDIPVAGRFYFQPGLLYSRKGFKQDSNYFAGSDNHFKVSVNYFEVPLHMLYKSLLGRGNLLFGAGLYVGYGTGGTWKSEREVVIGDIIHETRGDVIFKKDIRDGEWGTYLYGKPFDYGANFLAGYEFSDRLSVQVMYRAGFANLQPHVDGTKPDEKRKNIAIGISLGYKL